MRFFSSKYDDFCILFPQKNTLCPICTGFFLVTIVQKFSQKTNTGDEEGLVVVFVFFKEFWFVGKVTISPIRRCRKIDDDP